MAYGLLIDFELCSGCQSCEVACKMSKDLPVGKWGIRVHDDGPWRMDDSKDCGKAYNWNKIPVPTDLCNLCADRTSLGREPVCVHHCLANVMRYGTVEELAKHMDGSMKQVLWVPKQI